MDDDRDTLALVARELNVTGDVISADCAEKARRVLATDRIDLAIVDTHLGMVSGLDLLPDIRDRSGNIIPVIIFSSRVQSFLKSAVRDRLRLSPTKRRSHDMIRILHIDDEPDIREVVELSARSKDV